VAPPAAAPPQGGTGYVLPPPVPTTPEEETKHKKKPGIGALIFVGSLLCCAIIAIAAAYFYYADYFSKRFFPGTIINERDVSVLEPAQVKQDIANEIVTYHLDIKELNDVTETITSEDIALAYVDDGSVDKILKEQDTKFWFLRLLGTKTYEVSTGTTYDREKAEQVVNGLSCLNPENITAPADAQLVDNGTSFSIQPEVEGNQLDEEKFRAMVFDALDSGATEIDVVKDDCYLHPSKRSDDENLNTRMNEYNAILGVNVYYVFGENTEYVNADTLRPYITDDGNHVTLSGDYARKIVYGWGQKYDTFGLAREFTTHSGEVITLPAGGDYGWVINKDVTIADVQDAVTTQAAGERTPTFLYKAMGWDNGDITGTYVEVSISEQHLWCYHNYELVMDTDVVTGLPTSERETRRGIYAIDAKKEHATLGRLDVQGYASPVDYWAPFDGGRGLHDAPWRSSFGGDIYLYDGSHGCVNIPSQNMAAIYNAIEIGNAVIIY
ncbi:MAG: L,D-transpeptidase/peptidoglycan binding protein, partial [Lachnospiraceae bacterium]|nr:L,D-transpeptidase/peptidoglycan binding protein [Lachnospiraceae bacterium]